MEKNLEKFEELACKLGAVQAKIIDVNSVIVAPWVLFKCQFGCPDYNTSWCCPPNTPTPAETKELIACYKKALLFQCKESKKPREFIFDLEREIFLDGYYKAIGLSAGKCRLCIKCSPKKCIKPEMARPSMEACGIDIFGTVRASGMPIEVLQNQDSEGNWYGLVLID